MTSYASGIIAALVLTIFVVEMLRRGILQEKFAALWLVVSVGLLLIAVFPQILVELAALLGVQVPANLLFFLAALLLLVVSIQLSFEVSRLESRTRRLAEEIALLSYEVTYMQGIARDDSGNDAA